LGALRPYFFQHPAIKFVKFVCHKEDFSNFVSGEHSDISLYYFVIAHYKDTKNIANNQIIRQLFFIELTLK